MSESFQLGPFTVRLGLRRDNPLFPVFLIFRGPKLIGKQFSRPCQTDCEWLERENCVYATESVFIRIEQTRGVHMRRRGRPRKEEAARELEEAIASS